MPPSSSEPPSTPHPTLLVKWRSQLFTVPAPSSLTLADLKSHLHTLTHVPPARQKLLFPSSKRPHSDSQLLTALFRNGRLPPRPIMLLGTPAAVAEAAAPPPPDHTLPDVVDDLDDLLIPPVAPRPPPRVPRPPYLHHQAAFASRRMPRRHHRLPTASPTEQLPDEPSEHPQDGPDAPSDRADAPAADPAGADALLAPHGDHSPFVPPREDVSATNGATLSLESLFEALRPAQTGMAFITQRMTPSWMSPWTGSDVASFADAVSSARQQLAMLVVVMFDFSAARDASQKLLRAMVDQPRVRGVLDRAFHTVPVDLGTLQDGGAGVLRRLGLHAAPAVVILGDVGSGVLIVDMFNTEWFGDVEEEEGASSLAMKLEDTVVNFDGFYETARARTTSDTAIGRRRLIQQAQNAALQESLSLDQARERRERAAAEERRRREEEEAQMERRRLEEERRREQETEEARRMLPSEPETGGVTVILRMPDGRRVERRYEETSSVRDVFNLAVSEGVQKGSFELRAAFPTRVFADESSEESLQDAGLVPSVILNVEH